MVSVGFPESAMPAWRSLLSVEQRWELVHYLRVLASGNP
jgi:mono/diheme cytochrome c family protein